MAKGVPTLNKTLILKSTGGAGLGDLVRTVLSGLHYAQLTDRSIYVSWDDGLYGEEGENIFPRLFDLTGILFAENALSASPGQTVQPAAWLGRLDWPLNRVYSELRQDEWDRRWALKHMSFDQTRFDHTEQTLVMWDFDGLPASWPTVPTERRLGDSPDAAQRLLARRHLRPAAEVTEGVGAVYESRFSPHMIGVHVRKTSEKGGESRHMDLGAVFFLVDRLLAGGGDQVGVFLATDNQEVEAAFRTRYPCVASTSKWFGAPGVALHFNDEAPDKTRVAIEALIDLYLLAACDWLIHPSESSFSRVAAVLGDIPPQRVYGVPPGSPTWRRQLRAWRWVLRAASSFPPQRGELPYFLLP